jgi:flagellar protein FlaG
MSTTAPIPAILPDVAPISPSQAVAPASSAASSTGDAGNNPAPAAPQTPAPSPAATTPLDVQADLRLVIEEDKAAGSYVYMTIDPRTGKVIAQIPREEVLRMKDDAGYTPGSIINSRS